MTKILHLGHVIGKERVKVHMEKIKAILDWPSPRNLIELRGFIDICTYYRKFVQGLSKFTTPLTCITKKGVLFWSKEDEQTLKKMKQVMSSFSILALS